MAKEVNAIGLHLPSARPRRVVAGEEKLCRDRLTLRPDVDFAVSTEENSQIRLVKRYANRKLYDVQASQYITLDGIRELVRQGEDVRVVDNESGEDLTRLTLAQIIYEEERRKNGVISLPLLRWFVERGDEAMRDIMRSMEKGREAFETMREATEKRVQQLMHAPHQQLDQLQKRIDAQVERFTSHPAIQSEIKRIEENIKLLEKRLSRLTQGKSEQKRARKKKR